MLSTWKKISENGIYRRTDIQLAKKIRITNQLSASLAVIAACYCFVFYFAGFKKEGIGVTMVVAGILAPLLLNRYRHYTLARMTFITAINLAVIIYSYIFGAETGIQYVFFPCACLPWLFFDVKEKANIAVGMLIPTAALMIFLSTSGAPMVDIALSVQHGIRNSLVVAVFVIIALCMLFFALQNERAEQNLSNANKALQQSKEELESQQEELRQINEELTHQAEELRTSEEELRNQEEELRQINTELEEKSELIEMARSTLADKAAELEASGRYKSEFLANMSHELRTPLNSILILAGLLKQDKFGNLNEKQLEYAAIIHKSGTDLLNLINDILDLSKIEAGKVDFVYEQVGLADIADDMQQLFVVLANEKRITLSINIEKSVPEKVVTDRQRVGQVVKNLLSNAFKFTPETGSVSLGFSTENDRLLIAVKDTGIGIPEDKLEHIFEAFRQADGSTSRKFGGTGLGLSISRELMKRLGGSISVQSVPEEGSTFTLSLPFDSSAVYGATGRASELPTVVYVAENVTQQTAVQDDRKGVEPGQQSVLIIEDDTVFAAHVKDFAHDKGYKALVAISGDEGLYYAKKYKPSAIILDLGLPVIDGRNLLKILKSDEELKHIPVHVVSAGDRSDIPALDIENYFRKPLNDNDLSRAFSDIALYIDKYKNILLYTQSNNGIRETFRKLASEKGDEIVYDVVSDMEEATRELQHKKVDCIVVDIGSGTTNGNTVLQQLRELTGPDTYFITCIDDNISAGGEKALKVYSDCVISKSPHYGGRLLDEIELFLHKIKKPPKMLAKQQDKEFDKSLEGKKVLLTDDDMRNIFSITALLEEHGMNVITAEHGREALEQLEQNADVDIVLMDIMMPEMDGYEAMRRIRANMRFKSLPIIALTAKAMTGDKEKCIEAGASDYITKPVDANKLFSLMRVWLS